VIQHIVGLAVACVLVVSIGPAAASDEAVDVEALGQGLWAVAFVVLPEIPECEPAIEWLGELQHSFPEVGFLALSPWLTDELREAAARAELPLALDEEAQLGMRLGIDDVPAVLTLREGRVTNRLVWPFDQEELRASVTELATTPDEGPAAHVGEELALGTAATFGEEEVDLDAIDEPLLLYFFSPMCPACWRGLPALGDLAEEVEVALVILFAGAMTDAEREELRETGLPAVLDEDLMLTEALSIRLTPTYVLRDGAGVIRWAKETVLDPEDLRQAVRDVLSEPEEDGSQ